MPHDSDPLEGQRYASLRLRLRAFLFDMLIMSVVAIISMSAMGRFQESQSANVGILIVLMALALLYEPLMVSSFEGTLGHRWSNLRIVDARAAIRLPIWRAFIRTLVKGFFGMLSFVFIFITRRSQALHDVAARSVVTIRNPELARRRDYFRPRAEQPNRSLPSRTRRVAVIGAYLLLVFLVFIILQSMTVSDPCLLHEACSGAETATSTLLGGLLILGLGATVLMGWTGRLPGCRAVQSA